MLRLMRRLHMCMLHVAEVCQLSIRTVLPPRNLHNSPSVLLAS